MLFNSYTFWTFYLLVFLAYWALKHRHQNTLLLIASYVFYGAWDWRFLFLIFTSTLIDFILAQYIHGASIQKRKKFYLVLSIIANLTVLGFFKYYNFFSFELNSLFVNIGITSMLPTLDVILPVGISFYTFQTMSYSIDVYRDEIKPTRNFKDYALYVSFFPQLVAGPIERSSRLLPQVLHKRKWEKDYFLEGLYLIFYGLFLKIVIADNMAPITNYIFSKDASQLGSLEILLGIYAFAFQIYGDFAGYSSIARGIAKWLGFDLMVNFRMPYFAKDPSDFWKRWHISLSSWFRDYVYIPLGGNRDGKLASHRNLILTMFLSGLWHGAAWTYVLWGILHGLYLSIFNVFKIKKGKPSAGKNRVKSVFSMILMFHLVCLAWLLFRAKDFDQAWSFLIRLFSLSMEVSTFFIGSVSLMVFYIVPLLSYEYWTEKRGLMALSKHSVVVQALFYVYIIIMLLFFPSPTAHEFIYFQF